MGKYSIQFYNTLEQGSNASDNTNKNLQELTYKDHLYPYTEGVEATIESDNYKVTWASFSLHKRVYNAGKLELTFDISVEGSTLNIDKANTIYNQFKGYKSLRMQDNTVSDHLVVTNTVDLLTHYVIFNCKRIVTNARYSIVVTAYSPDKLLTIDKFNRAFTGKKFYADMVSGYLDTTGDFLQTAAAKNTFLPNLDAYKSCGVQLFNGLSNLTYTIKENEVSVRKEALLPYTVQHNESIWDFLVRIASRNGEFLFCENGQLHVGVSNVVQSIEFVPSGTTCTLSQIAFDIMEEDACGYFQDASTLFDNNYLDSERSVEQTIVTEKNQLYSSECIISPEINELVQKTDFSSIDDYVQHVKFIFDSLGTFFSENSILDGIANIGVAAFNSYYSGSLFVEKDNEKYNNYYFPSDNANGSNPKDPLYADKKKDGEENFYLFASSLKLLNNQFYHAVCKDSDYSRKHKLTFQFSEYVDLPLGAIVQYNGANYRVWSVEMEHGICVVTVIPIVKCSDTAVGKVLAKEGDADTDVSMPIIDKTKRIAKATSQRAVVVDNYDPLQLGRVRVRYPWQPVANNPTSDTYAGTLYNDISPWLRIVLPMASEGAGFMFMPNVGDEVMVDYEDGNIDRPYVCGAMYSINHQPGYHASMQLRGRTKSICTNNGHHLAFTDKPGDVRMLARMIPFWTQLSSLGMFNGEIDKELLKYTTGGFEIADYLGIYSISGSTENRKVSIDSPLGKVSVSALTGISIEAPLGDVSIVGKNVRIEARNNLSIEAGTNIGHRAVDLFTDDRKKAFGSLGRFAVTAIKGVAGVDFKFLRCMAEALLKPIGGGLAIKSLRYITISSGEGDAKFRRNYSYDKVRNSEDEFRFRDIARVFTNSGDSKVDDDIEIYGRAKASLRENIRKYNDIQRDVQSFSGYLDLVNEYLANNKEADFLIFAGGEILDVQKGNTKDLFATFKRKADEVNGGATGVSISENEVLTGHLQSMYQLRNRIKRTIEQMADANKHELYKVLDSDLTKLNNLVPDIDDVLANGCSFKGADFYALIGPMRAKRLLYNLIKEHKSIGKYIDVDSEPANMSEDALRSVILLKKRNKVGAFATKAVDAIASNFVGNGILDDWSWSKSNKGGIVISNNDSTMFTFDSGQFNEIDKEPEQLPNELVNDILTFTI